MEVEKTNQKVLTLSFVIASLLTLLVTKVLFDTLGGLFPLVEQLRANDVIKHGLPVIVAASLFFSLQFNVKVKTWGQEVIVEIRKIVWPSQRDTVVTTIAVCVMVVVAGIGFSVVDYLSSIIIKWLVH